MLVAERAKHRYMGLETEIVGPEEIAKLAPITNLDGIIGALYDPLDGHLDPSGTTHAYAKAARMGGGDNRDPHNGPRNQPAPRRHLGCGYQQGHDPRRTRRQRRRSLGTRSRVLWRASTCRYTRWNTSTSSPRKPLKSTSAIPSTRTSWTPRAKAICARRAAGLCIGFYEQPCKPWAVDGTPWNFGHELLPDNLDKVEASIEFAFKRFPVLETAGIKIRHPRTLHLCTRRQPACRTRSLALRNYWSACGVMAGFSQGGGVGLMLAQWMIEGECERDVTALDVGRFGTWITPGYTRPKVIENYQRRFSVSYPNEELPAARPHRTTPMYDIFSDMGAVWGQQFGLEVVNYLRARRRADLRATDLPPLKRLQSDRPRGESRAISRRHQRSPEFRQIRSHGQRRPQLARHASWLAAFPSLAACP